jgi:hypothetical protein
MEIDNPSNKNVIDCATLYKDNLRAKKSKNINTKDDKYSLNNNSNSNSNKVKERYNLSNFVV